ncbi:MAG: hypothetical protein J5744_08525 [Oscillospiraceae bacterium]|nr:hypothetical protein [Oscillospiraceae bacterium]
MLSVLAFALILVAGISSTLGYFTAKDKVAGKIQLSLVPYTEIDEEYDEVAYEKLVTVENTGKQPVYVRVIVFTGSEVDVTISGSADSSRWTKGEGDDPYWYYADPVDPLKTTEEKLVVHVELPENSSNDIDLYNVVVIQEYTPVRYDAEGNPYGDWTITIKEEG